MPGFKQVPAGSSYSRITQGRLSQKHRRISTSEGGKETREETEAIDIFFGVCGVAVMEFQMIKSEL